MNALRPQETILAALTCLLLTSGCSAADVATDHASTPFSRSTSSPIPISGPTSSPTTGPVGPSDGVLPEGQAATGTGLPGIDKLDAQLLEALRRASADAKSQGIAIVITSGWRSERYQQSLLDEAITNYGSKEEALHWVSSPEKSSHVLGKAIDVGPTSAADWLIQHGSSYGLCQSYANEMWHFELTTRPGSVCPAPAASPNQSK
ncbi:M15 family metallopeptidase [Arthrobacter methylotrophus]|uniref:M15 family metallopeptidase n=1 Tax=Arthrobacter methylotrophus TaxID=121291 RepID=A0ABV5UPN2_9MICC